MFTVVMSLTVIFFSTVAKINKIFISFSSLQRIHGVVGKNNGETNIYNLHAFTRWSPNHQL